MNQDELQALEATAQAMHWENVSLSPSPTDVQALDQQLPAEWVQTLEQETAFTQEEVDALLNTPLDVPEGHFDDNARQAINELGIDVPEIMQELDHAPSLDLPEISQEHDFGR